MQREFSRESDRAAGIVASSMLDEALRLLLVARLQPPVGKDHDIVNGYQAPLGTFSARINACQQLGLISKWLARDLHIVRAIRNAFAHQTNGCTFERPDIRDRVRALEGASDFNRRHPALRAIMGPAGPRGDFLGVVSWILFGLHKEAEEAKPLAERGPEFGYIEWESLPPEIRELLERATAT